MNLKESSEEISERIIASNAELPKLGIKKGTISEENWRNFAEDTGEIGELPLKLSNLAYEDKTIDKIINIIKKDTYDFIIIDELDSIHSDKEIYKKDKTKHIMNKLKGLTNDIKTPVMLLCQISKETIKNRNDKRPTIADLTYDSLRSFPTIIHLLYCEEYYYPSTVRKSILEVIIPKGQLGFIGSAELFFNNKSSVLSDLKMKNN